MRNDNLQQRSLRTQRVVRGLPRQPLPVAGHVPSRTSGFLRTGRDALDAGHSLLRVTSAPAAKGVLTMTPGRRIYYLYDRQYHSRNTILMGFYTSYEEASLAAEKFNNHGVPAGITWRKVIA